MNIEEMKKQRDELTRQIEEAEAAEAEKKTKAEAGSRARYSGYILPELWEDFTNINRKLSVTNNSRINLLIALFVRQHKDLLEE